MFKGDGKECCKLKNCAKLSWYEVLNSSRSSWSKNVTTLLAFLTTMWQMENYFIYMVQYLSAFLQIYLLWNWFYNNFLSFLSIFPHFWCCIDLVCLKPKKTWLISPHLLRPLESSQISIDLLLDCQWTSSNINFLPHFCQ